MWLKKDIKDIKDINVTDKKFLKKINNPVEQNYYREKRKWVKGEYEKDDRYNSLDNIRLEKERILGKLSKMNSQFPALIIALIIMYISLNIPALSRLFSNFSSHNLDAIIQIILTVIVFFYVVMDLSKSSDEFNYLTICRYVLEELEEECLEKPIGTINKIIVKQEENDRNEIIEENDKEKRKIGNRFELLFFSGLFIFLISIIFIIAATVKSHEWKDPILIDNWLIYYGTIIGALIGGFITATGLYITLKLNAKSLSEQRKIDKEARDDQERLFDKDYNIKIINDKLNIYKEVFDLRTDIVVAITKFKGEMIAFCKNNIHVYDEFFKIAGKFEFLSSQIDNVILRKNRSEIIKKCYEFKNKLLTEKITEEQIDLVDEINQLLNNFSDELIRESKALTMEKYKN